jgi:hypothetical protein
MALSALSRTTVSARAAEDASLPPLPWRRMAWVTWRQHRSALTGAAALAVGVAVLLWIAGLRLHHAYAAAISCHPAGSLACGALINTFDGTEGFLSNGLVLQVVPALIGAFIGAPVLARELENGTIRFAWTQGLGRLRWTLAKLAGLGTLVVVAAGALSILMSWYYGPYFAGGNQALSFSEGGLVQASPFAVGLFDLRGVTFAAWTLVAFAIGGLAGTLIRRVVPAIVTTLAVYAGLAVLTGGRLRARYVTPLVTSNPNLTGSAWIVGQHWTNRAGRPVSQSVIDQVLLRGPASVAGKGPIPKASNTLQYLLQHGYTQVTSYQPASRFWPFQWIEGGWLLALSALLIAVTVWLVRRRAV